MLTALDAPAPGFTSVSTLSMHRSPNLVSGTDVRVELVTVLEHVEERLATGCSWPRRSPRWESRGRCRRRRCSRGSSPTCSAAAPSTCCFTAPGNFPRLSRYRLEPGVDVHWLQAVPVHESERRFLLEHGLDALEERFETAEVPFYDITRDAVV